MSSYININTPMFHCLTQFTYSTLTMHLYVCIFTSCRSYSFTGMLQTSTAIWKQYYTLSWQNRSSTLSDVSHCFQQSTRQATQILYYKNTNQDMIPKLLNPQCSILLQFRLQYSHCRCVHLETVTSANYHMKCKEIKR